METYLERLTGLSLEILRPLEDDSVAVSRRRLQPATGGGGVVSSSSSEVSGVKGDVGPHSKVSGRGRGEDREGSASLLFPRKCSISRSISSSTDVPSTTWFRMLSSFCNVSSSANPASLPGVRLEIGRRSNLSLTTRKACLTFSGRSGSLEM